MSRHRPENLPERRLIRFAKDCEDVVAGISNFRNALPRAATRITATISELFAISAVLREIDNGEADPRYAPSRYRIQDDLDLVFESLQRTLATTSDMFERANDRPYQVVWDEMADIMEDEEGMGLLERLERYNDFLKALFDIITGVRPPDMRDSRDQLISLLNAQQSGYIRRRRRETSVPPIYAATEPMQIHDDEIESVFSYPSHRNGPQAPDSRNQIPRRQSSDPPARPTAHFGSLHHEPESLIDDLDVKSNGTLPRPGVHFQTPTPDSTKWNNPASRRPSISRSERGDSGRPPLSRTGSVRSDMFSYSSPSYAKARELILYQAHISRRFGRLGATMPASAYRLSDNDISEYAELEFDETLFPKAKHESTNNSEIKPSKESPSQKLDGLTEINIVSSRWMANTTEPSDFSAQLDVCHAPPQGADSYPVPKRTWCHLERPTMNFDEFISASQTIPGIAESHRGRIRGMLLDYQRRNEKQLPKGRQLTADFVPDSLPPEYSAKSRDAKAIPVAFFSFKYLCLEKYNSQRLEALGRDSPMHPLRSLLQNHFQTVPEKRELAQAVSTVINSARRQCLHVSEIWVLIIGDQTLLTCGRLSVDVMRKEVFDINQVFSTDSSYIEINAAAGRTWLAPAEAITSWPALISLFTDRITDIGGLNPMVDITVGSQVVDSEVASQLVAFSRPGVKSVRIQRSKASAGALNVSTLFKPSSNSSQNSNGQIDLNLTDSENVQSDKEGILNPPGPQTSGDRHSVVDGLLKRKHKPLNVFQDLDSFGSNAELRETADKLHATLLSYHRQSEKTLYSKCPAGDIADVDKWLDAYDVELDRDEMGPEFSMVHYKKAIAVMAKETFTFFWPMNFQHQMTDKFWGALHSFLCRESFYFHDESSDTNTQLCYEVYYAMFNDGVPLVLSLTQSCLEPRERLPCPSEFIKAWLHLLLSFVCLSESSLPREGKFKDSTAYKHLRNASRMLDEGDRALTAQIRPADVRNFESCSMTSLVGLCVEKLLKDVTHGLPDIYSMYNDAIQRLEFSITQDPLQRSHQETIRFFRQEIEAILAVIEEQSVILNTFDKYVSDTEGGGTPIEELLPRVGISRRDQVFASCMSALLAKIDLFRALRPRLDELGNWHRDEIQSNKDRQETAIIVFTIVTIVFLPLSFVASVFGMNTRDIRNMPLNQWVYWVSAIPLTILVVLGALWCAGEFPHIGHWISRWSAPSNRLSGGVKPLTHRATRSVYPSTQNLAQSMPSGIEQRSQMFSIPRQRSPYPLKPNNSTPVLSRRSTGRSII